MTKPLFKLNGWAITRLADPHSIPGLDVFANHVTCKKPLMYCDETRNEVSWLIHEPPFCWACNKSVPDEIQALLNLHEWDKNKTND